MENWQKLSFSYHEIPSLSFLLGEKSLNEGDEGGKSEKKLYVLHRLLNN